MVLYKKIRHFLNRLPESKMADLQTAFPNLNAELDRVEKNLEHNKCAILVAGMGILKLKLRLSKTETETDHFMPTSLNRRK